jgi:hypothetical protein
MRSAIIGFAVLLAAGSAHADAPSVVAVPGAPALLLGNFDLAPLVSSTE